MRTVIQILTAVLCMGGLLGGLREVSAAVPAAQRTLVPTVGASPIPVNPIYTATPGPNGEVIHEVLYGHTLSGIAQAYQISLGDLLSRNGLTAESSIFPGDRLIIVPGSTPAPTAPATDTPEPTAAPTRTPRPPTLTPTLTPIPSITPTLQPTSRINLSTLRIDRQTAGIGIIAICVLGLILVGITAFRRK